MVHQKIINGFTDGTFKPTHNIKRVDGVRMLLKAKGITNLEAPDPHFIDMPPGVNGYAEVAKAVQLGIISGKKHPNGSKYFDPSGQLTRGEMAKIIVQTMQYPIDRSITFQDVHPSQFSYAYISTLAKEKITNGYNDNTFKPNLAITRFQFTRFVARMLNDDFKQGAVLTKYGLDPKMNYTLTMTEDNQNIPLTLTYSGKYTSERVTADQWKMSGAEENRIFVSWEDKQGLYKGYPLSEYYQELSYPVYKGKVFSDGWDNLHTISATNLTVTTPAGTFKDVVEVKDDSGAAYYYAPNVGHIKVVIDGKTTMTLTNLIPR